MPRIIDYDFVLRTLEGEGFTCVYPNGGAFAFKDRSRERFVGWITAEDASLRAEARQHARLVDPPTSQRLANLFAKFWTDDAIGGNVWLMPKSHWAHELHHGSGGWMSGLLRSIAIDPGALESRTTADAIEFTTDEVGQTKRCVAALLDQLRGSDFAATFRAVPMTCTLHHHRQLWWQTTDERAFSLLDRVAPSDG